MVSVKIWINGLDCFMSRLILASAVTIVIFTIVFQGSFGSDVYAEEYSAINWNRDLWITASNAQGPRLNKSQWGGEGISMQIGSDSTDIEFDCASGAMPAVPVADAKGRFSVEGTFSPRHPGPIRDDVPAAHKAAVYSGKVSGDRMTLTVKLKNGDVVGNFTLDRDKSGPIRGCR